MTSRSPARWLAPLALLAAIVAVLAMVSSSLGGGDGGTPAPTEPAAEQTQTTGDGEDGDEQGADTEPTDTTAEESGPRTYTVQPGDTLGAISEETGVAVERLQELNPNVDSQALSVGQVLRLRERG